MSRDPLLRVLKEAPELVSLCTQNGWIDNDTLSYQIIEQETDCWLLAVQFEEIIMEGSGCVAGKKPCYGRVRVTRNLTETGWGVEIV